MTAKTVVIEGVVFGDIEQKTLHSGKVKTSFIVSGVDKHHLCKTWNREVRKKLNRLEPDRSVTFKGFKPEDEDEVIITQILEFHSELPEHKKYAPYGNREEYRAARQDEEQRMKEQGFKKIFIGPVLRGGMQAYRFIQSDEMHQW